MAPKRARTAGTGSSRQNPDADEPPQWGNKPLSTLPVEWQARLYQEKMRAMKNPGDTFICERHVRLDDFRNYGLVEGFERLGWTGALTINSEGNSTIYPDEIIQWMATLQRNDGTHPPWTTTLTGMVNGVVVHLSSETLSMIMEVDTYPRETYTQMTEKAVRCDVVRPEEWSTMIDAIFDVPYHMLGEQSPLHVRNLRPLPRLLYKILTWNVVPRLSDKAKVRTADIRPMYAVLTGESRFPFYQLLIQNIWESRESSKKMVVPHCRMITELLKGADAIPRGARKAVVSPTPFDRAHLNKPDFQFKETFTHFVLRDEVNKRKQEFPKPPVEQPTGDEDDDEGRGEYEQYGSREGFRAYPNHPVGYQDWSPHERAMYDRQEHHWERQTDFNNRQIEMYDQLDRRMTRVEQTVDVMAYYQQKYHHDFYDYMEQSRHHHDYVSGLPYQPQPQPRDYSRLPRFDWQNSDQQQPSFPAMARPSWYGHGESSSADPRRASTSSQSTDAPDPFDMRPLAQGLFEDFFGERYPH